MLLALPLPTLSSLQTPWRTKGRLYILCALGLFIIAITIIRLPINAMHAAVQANRTTWASTELLAAAIVVNAPVLYGSFNIWRQRSYSGSHVSTSRAGNSSAIRTTGSVGQRRQSAKVMSMPDDDEELMLRLYGHTSTTSNRSYQVSQDQEGTINKTIVVSLHDAKNAYADKRS
jgi:hypothetical protein